MCCVKLQLFLYLPLTSMFHDVTQQIHYCLGQAKKSSKKLNYLSIVLFKYDNVSLFSHSLTMQTQTKCFRGIFHTGTNPSHGMGLLQWDVPGLPPCFNQGVPHAAIICNHNWVSHWRGQFLKI